MSDYFVGAGLLMKRLWHCFGNERDHIGIDGILELLRISETNVLPINTHRLTLRKNRAGLVMGYGDVTYDALRNVLDVTSYIRMLNINLAGNSREAVERARCAHQLTGERVLKLEVLDVRRRTSNDDALIEAVTELNEGNEEFVIMPLVSANVAAARKLVELGCPVLRVMGSPIGSGSGITAPADLRACCRLGVPVVLDGGVGNVADYHMAMHCGAQGVLINSMLFAKSSPPADIMRNFVSSIHKSTSVKTL
jgi:thiazole synthase